MKLIRKIRKGKDIAIIWTITTNGTDVSLEGRDLYLELSMPNGVSVKLPCEYKSNALMSTFRGKDHKYTGVHSLTLWENYGKLGQNAIDKMDAFELVKYTTMENSGGSDDNLSIETLDLGSDDFKAWLKGLSAYEIALNHGFVGTEEEWLMSLPQPAVEAAQRLESLYNSEVISLRDNYNSIKKELEQDYNKNKNSLDTDYQVVKDSLSAEYDALKEYLSSDYVAVKQILNKQYTDKVDELERDYTSKISALSSDYESKKNSMGSDYESVKDNLASEYARLKESLSSDYSSLKANLEKYYNEKSDALEEDFKTKTLALTSDHTNKTSALENDYINKKDELEADYTLVKQNLASEYATKYEQLVGASSAAVEAARNAETAAVNANNAAERANASASNADEKASLVADNIEVNTQRVNAAVQESAEAKSAAESATATSESAVATSGEAKTIAERAETIAKGRATGYVFDTLDDMNTWVSSNKDKLVLGDNLYIRDTGVSDYWWDGTSVQKLETEHPDLSGYIKNTDWATTTKAGVVIVSSGLFVNAKGEITVKNSSEQQILSKTDMYRPIVPSNLDYAVKVGVTTNTIALTAAEKAAAQRWFGITPITASEYEALADKSGINYVIPD